MGKITGFIEFDRVDEKNKAVKDRIHNYKEFTVKLPEEELQKQGKRFFVYENSSQTSSLVAGFSTAMVAPLSASTHLPSM